MPAFILFEPSPDPLKRRPDLRDRAPTSLRRHALIAGQPVAKLCSGRLQKTDHSGAKHYREVVDPGDGRVVLGHPPVKSALESGPTDVGRDGSILLPAIDRGPARRKECAIFLAEGEVTKS